MKRFAPVIGLAALIALLVFINQGINKVSHPDHDEDEPAESSQPAPPKPAGPQPAVAPGGEDTGPPAEITVGDPAKARHQITVGWIYDEANQPQPQALTDALEALRKAAQASNGSLSAELVNLDAPTEELSPRAGSVPGLGVFIDGTQAGPAANPGTTGLTAQDLAKLLPK